MKVAQIWRYPVKSMAGERLDSATIDSLGIAGDRVVHVENARGRFITARTHPRLLGHHAKLNSSGEPLVDGTLWTNPQVLRQVVEIVGVIAMFGFLNRWNDTFATPLEDEPLEFGEKHLTAQGWDAGKHLR